MNEENNLNETVNTEITPEVTQVENSTVSEEINNTVAPEKSPKKKSKLWIIIAAVVLVLLIGVGVWYFAFYKKPVKEEKKEENRKNNYTEVETLYSASDYALKGNDIQDFDLLFLQMDNNKENKVYSPLSIKYALQMLASGADGETKEEIDTLIGEYTTKKYVNSNNLSLANAFFIRNSYKEKIQNNYVNNLKTNYNAEVIYDDFKTANVINTWVSNQTFNLINDLLSNDSVQSSDYILVNSLAINMEWVYAIQYYYPEGTVDSMGYSVRYQHEALVDNAYSGLTDEVDYFGADSIEFEGVGTVPVAQFKTSANKYDIVSDKGKDTIINDITTDYDKFLSENPQCTKDETLVNNTYDELTGNYTTFKYSTDFSYYVDDDVKVFAKDLKKYDGTTLEYVGIMPKNGTLEDYVKNISSKEIDNYIKNLKDANNYDSYEEGKITFIKGDLPLFNFEYELDLINSLQKLGIKSVFNPSSANLSKLTSDSDAYISSVSHKANIEFSNLGIKAAAATAIGGRGAAGGDCYYYFSYNITDKVVKIDLDFNRPYMFIIRDKDTGEVWFTGTVYEPSTELEVNE